MAEHSNIEWTDAIKDVAAERHRQIHNEGFTPEHDDQHTDESLAVVAAIYAAPFPVFGCERGEGYFTFEDPWPVNWCQTWDARGRHERRKQLVVAAALLLAEIERLDRRSTEAGTNG